MTTPKARILLMAAACAMAAHLPLQAEDIETTILEDRSRDYVEARVRAGVIEQGIVDLLTASGAAALVRPVPGLVAASVEPEYPGRTPVLR